MHHVRGLHELMPLHVGRSRLPGSGGFRQDPLYTFDTRDAGADERLPLLDASDGLWKCYTIFNCVEACPKDIEITRWISALKCKATTRGG